MSERSEDLDVTALEAALRELRPRSERLDRAVLMYRAGQAATRGWLWPIAALCSSTAALVLSILLWMRPAPPVVYVAVPSAPIDEAPSSPPSPLVEQSEREAWSRYVHLQEQVLLHGLDGLPAPSGAAEEQAPDAKSLLDSL